MECHRTGVTNDELGSLNMGDADAIRPVAEEER
jgi:hypothetical protein